MGNCAMMSAEAMEVEVPVRVLKTELVADSGGPGEHRGGLALERWYELLAEEANLSGRYADQTLEETRPWAAEGGLPGARAAVLLDLPLCRGDVLVMRSSGGGGWGDPRRRDPAAIAADLRDGYITPEHAHDAYGWDDARGRDRRGMEGGRS
jgi:N-methylhydantoinase B